jgi:predicted dehydrogenase
MRPRVHPILRHPASRSFVAFRVVILGTSFGRNVQAVALRRHRGFELVGISGAREESVRRAAAELGIPLAGTDWRRVLEQARPDLTCVTTPVDLHHPMTLGALELGSHVLCEKPTALHRFQAAEMREAARRRGRIAGIDHEFRFFPARRAALRLVRAGAIGAPRRGEILGRYAIWPRPESRAMTWLSEARRGGGVLGALGSHHTDALRLFFGEPQTVLASVRVDQPWRSPVDGAGERMRATADDGCTVHYEFANGCTGLIDLSATAPYRWERFEIHGAEATLRWDETGYRLWRLAAGKEPEEMAFLPEERLDRRPDEHALIAPFGALLDRIEAALAGRQRLEPDLDDGVAVQSALDAARASSDAGTRVRVEIPRPLPDGASGP